MKTKILNVCSLSEGGIKRTGDQTSFRQHLLSKSASSEHVRGTNVLESK